MATTIGKKEMRRDPLVEWTANAVRVLQSNRTSVLVSLAALCLAGILGAGYWWYQGQRERAASLALAQASAAARTEQPGTPANTDEAIKRYRDVELQYRGTRGGEEAMILIANLLLDSGKTDDAIRRFGEYLSEYSRGRFRMIASLGKAYAEESKGDLQGSANTLSQALESSKDDPMAGEAYLSLGRVYESLKKPEEAMRIYGQVVERYSQSQWAQRALQRMSALKTK